MQKQVFQSNIGIMPILNSNRITDNQQKEAIKAMGLSSCNVKCIALEIGKGKYISKA